MKYLNKLFHDRFFFYAFLFIIGLGYSPHIEAQDDSSFSTLQSVTAESDKKSTSISLKFDSKISMNKIDPEFHGTFIQLVLPSTRVLESGKFYDASGPLIRKVATFQLSPGRGAVRLFVTREASDFDRGINIDYLDDRIILFFNHAKISDGGKSPDILESKIAVNKKNVKKVIAATKVRTNIEDPARLIAGDKMQPASSVVTSFEDGLNDRVVTATVFSAVMLFILLASFGYKKMRLRKAVGVEKSGIDLQIQTISSYAISAKQRLTLVQVGQEQVLLGVSPDSINFLKTIDQGASGAQENLIRPQMANRSNAVRGLVGGTSTPASELSKINGSDRAIHSEASSRNRQVKPNELISKSRGRSADFGVDRVMDKIRKETDLNHTAGKTSKKSKLNKSPKRINVAIDNDGIRNQGSSRKVSGRARTSKNQSKSLGSNSDSKASQDTVEDVTNLIRRRLKDLPGI